MARSVRYWARINSHRSTRPVWDVSFMSTSRSAIMVLRAEVDDDALALDRLGGGVEEVSVLRPVRTMVMTKST